MKKTVKDNVQEKLEKLVELIILDLQDNITFDSLDVKNQARFTSYGIYIKGNLEEMNLKEVTRIVANHDCEEVRVFTIIPTTIYEKGAFIYNSNTICVFLEYLV